MFSDFLYISICSSAGGIENEIVGGLNTFLRVSLQIAYTRYNYSIVSIKKIILFNCYHGQLPAPAHYIAPSIILFFLFFKKQKKTMKYWSLILQIHLATESCICLFYRYNPLQKIFKVASCQVIEERWSNIKCVKWPSSSYTTHEQNHLDQILPTMIELFGTHIKLFFRFPPPSLHL